MEASPTYDKKNIAYLIKKAQEIIEIHHVDKTFFLKLNGSIYPKIHIFHEFMHHYNAYMRHLMSFNHDPKENVFYGHIYMFLQVKRYKLDAIIVPSEHEIEILANKSFINWPTYVGIHVNNQNTKYVSIPCKLAFMS